MPADVAKLEKILRIEAADNYKDQKVYRGLAGFISNWTRDTLKSNPTPEEARLVERVAHELIEYGAMGLLQRARAIQAILDLTAPFTRGQGVVITVPVSPTAGRPTPPLTRPAVRQTEAVSTSQNSLASNSKPTAPVPSRTRPQKTTYPASEELTPTPTSPAADPSSLIPHPSSLPPVSPPSAALDLHASLTTVKGVGQAYAKLLSFLNLYTIHDALYHFPFRHDDFSSFKKISELVFNQTESVIAEVVDNSVRRMAGGKQLIEVVVRDETGSLSCVFFNQRQTYGLKPGAQVVLSGRVEQWNNRICFKSPSYEAADKDLTSTGRLVPVYPTTGPLKLVTLRKLIKTCVDRYAAALPEHLPAPIRERHGLLTLAQAVRDYHFPSSLTVREQARRRLAFDEFFMVQLGVLLKRYEWQEERPGVPVPVDKALLEQWYAALTFKVSKPNEETGQMEDEFRKLELTSAQQQAIADILADVQKPRPMNRLLQGDVGSGKTVVGATALLMAVASGFQGALMAPTQILAEQHFVGLRRLFDQFEQSPLAQERGLKVRLELLTGSVKKKDVVYRRIRDGEVDIVVGTSAVIEEVVTFHRLGLVIIDEQHRFGVIQRKTLRGKGAASAVNPEGANPHLLVMTATPIPRTLNLTVYGDLDLSLMNEMPPGRKPIKTKWVMPYDRLKAYDFVRKQIERGRQAFVICPLVEESDKIEAKAAVEEHERLQREVFPDLRLGLLHGRMKPAEKDLIMHQFRDREFDLLVATSVIEVGIDIPNATVIMIEGAERFGLSQLHQFRGRVGRGQSQSYCFLLAGEELSQTGRERLKAIEDTNDGFVLAEVDLRMRGPGEFFGTRQSGEMNTRVVGVNDVDLLEVAREEAIRLFEQDPGFSQPDHKLLSQKVAQLWSFEGDLS